MTSSDQLVASPIAGIVARKLTPRRDERGVFTELFRDAWGLGPRTAQWSIVESAANVLRGVHAHRTHIDYLALLGGEVVLLLHDLRRASPTHRRTDMLRLVGGDPSMVVIPPGVAHGFYFPQPACLVLATTHEFDGSDEFGCRWDAPELRADWPCHDPILSQRDAAAGTYDALLLELGV